ncbi:hypothetical protein ACTHQ8_06695 [Lysinibacillus odysseyi]|uniref:hypothetical protein n=1 Tax=Lysinibacillus odysseyi TaxID=202611 RepID=UPI000A43161F|nr:hypothetical protein [Lysinibacillus odysseyi]
MEWRLAAPWGGPYVENLLVTGVDSRNHLVGAGRSAGKRPAKIEIKRGYGSEPINNRIMQNLMYEI